MTSQNAFHFTSTIETSMGEFIGESSLTPIYNHDGKCIYILAIVRDITERTQKERELQEMKIKLETNQKRLSSLVRYNGDAVFEIDVHGLLISVNSMAIILTGYSEEELVGNSFSFLFSSETAEDELASYRLALRGQEEQHETWIQKKNGERVRLSVKNIPIVVDHIVVGVYVIARDITEISRIQAVLKATNEELRAFWNFSVDPVFLLGRDGKIKRVNPAFKEVFGYCEEEVMNTKNIIVPSEYLNDKKQIIELILKGEAVSSYETKRITKSGQLLDIIASYTPVYNENEIIGATAFYKNVTELKKTERKLLKSEEKFRLIAENVFDAINLVSPTGTVDYVSPSNQNLLGYSYSEFVGKKITTYVHPEDVIRLEKQLDMLVKEKKSFTIECRVLHKNGNYLWLDISITPIIEDGEIKQLVTIARDISERKKHREELSKMAFFDYLTGLPNRRTFDDRLHIAVEQASLSKKKVAVMMLDGHKFKQFNDTYGHDSGDQVIKELAKRLQENVRQADTVARLGGDEMGIILPELDKIQEAEDIAKRILNSIEKPLYINNDEIRIEVGIGIAFYPDHSLDQKQVVKFADQALYNTKENQHSTYMVYH